MVIDIISGITVRLHALFGDECKIYTEDKTQKLANKCFFVNTLETTQVNALGNRKYRGHPFNLTYISDGGKGELRAVLDKLLDGMEFIRLLDGSLMHGSGLRGEIVDGVLQFFVEYNAYVLTPRNDGSEKMEDLHINVKG